MTKIQNLKFTTLAKSPIVPSPLTGEGRGEGEKDGITADETPRPFSPLPPGEGKFDFCETIKPASPKVSFSIKLVVQRQAVALKPEHLPFK